MKKINCFLLFCLVFITISSADGLLESEYNIAIRSHIYSNRFFIIRFAYNPNIYSRPLTYPLGQLHYNATITIHEITDDLEILMYTPFNGQYTEKGCFEDDSESLIKRVLSTYVERESDPVFTYVHAITSLSFYEQWEKDMGKKWPYIKNDQEENIDTNIYIVIDELKECLRKWTPNTGEIVNTELKDNELIITKKDFHGLLISSYGVSAVSRYNITWKEVYGSENDKLILKYFIRGKYIPPSQTEEQLVFEDKKGQNE